MNLVSKITIALAVCALATVALNSTIRYQRETDLFDREARRDHIPLARALSVTIGQVWLEEGRPRALQLLDAANTQESHVDIALVDTWPEARAALDGRLSRDEMDLLGAGELVQVSGFDASGVEVLTTWFPVPMGIRPFAVVSISERLVERAAYVKRSIRNTLISSAALVLVYALLSLVFSTWMMGRPMRALVEKARRVGRGDLSGPLSWTRRDELGVLAREMDSMCEALARAQDDLLSESRAREQALRQLRHADRLATVGTLASGLAHELGTPLNVVGARAKMVVQDPGAPEGAQRHARIVVEQADRMAAIIRQLLDFARSSPLQRTAGDLARVASETVSLLAPLATRKRIDLSVELRAAPAGARIDARALQQAVTNLVVNAVQATPEGGAVVVKVDRAEVSPPPGVEPAPGGWLRLVVSDTGDGIAEEDLGRVFEPFFTTKDVGEGTGLGLSVAHGIVREHGGWIDVESEPGSGSRFAIHLPADSTAAT